MGEKNDKRNMKVSLYRCHSLFLLKLFLHSKTSFPFIQPFSYQFMRKSLPFIMSGRQTFLTPLLLLVTSQDDSSHRCLPLWQVTLFFQHKTVNVLRQFLATQTKSGRRPDVFHLANKRYHYLLSDCWGTMKCEVLAGQKLTRVTTHKLANTLLFCLTAVWPNKIY